MDADLSFEAEPADRATADPLLVVDVEGFEGPLDLLLDLARRQKVDLHEISILALVEQYLAFVEAARSLRLELAADYLVMAAWLAFLKSRLLLPEPARPEGPSAGELAQALAVRLQRLEAIRAAAARLAGRPQLGREVFGRGAREVGQPSRPTYTATIHDLLAAYAAGRRRTFQVTVTVERRPVWSLAEAREALERLIEVGPGWVELDAFLLRYCVEPDRRRTALASSLSAALEMVREGHLSLRQDAAFAPLMVRRCGPAIAAGAP